MTRIYMDANATTPLAEEVFEAMRPYWTENFANASSIHWDGQQARAAVDRAREQMAAFFGCREAEVVFNSGGTEGDNTAILGLLGAGDHFVTTSIEHEAVLRAAEEAQERGAVVTLVAPESDGRIAPEAIRAAIGPKTRLVSVMLANNETGVVEPVEEIGRIVAEAGAYFHIDAVQGAGKIPIEVERFGCHLLSISGHKMYGPKGVGALYVRRGTPLKSLLVGGKHERRRRAGTENVPGIVGLGKAAELAQRALAAGELKALAALRDRLEAGALRIAGVRVHGGGAERVANTTNIGFEGVEGEALVIALDLKGVAVSGGSACSSGATEPSHVLLAMGCGEAEARASLRFSLLRSARAEEIDRLLAMLPEAVAHLRELTAK